MAAKGKIITDQAMINVAKKVMEDNKQSVLLKTDVEAGKNELKEHCRKVFFTDLGANLDKDGNPVSIELEKTVEINGNHEFTTTEGLLTVNFKAKGLDLEDIEGIPAPNYLKGTFGKAYKDLFMESENHVVDPFNTVVSGLALKDPAQYRYALRYDLNPQQEATVAKLTVDFPGLFQVQPKDMEAFAKTNQSEVTSKTLVNPVDGFIEKLGNIDAPALKNAQPFLVGFFKRALDMAVKCGNAAKTAGKKK